MAIDEVGERRRTAVPAPRRRGPGSAPVPGIVLAAVVAVAATALAQVVPLVGAPVLAITAGVLIGIAARKRTDVLARIAPGIGTASTTVLQLAVVVLGSQLSLAEVVGVGVGSLPVMLGTLATCLGAAWLIGRALRIDADLRTLIGVGTAICGASAIAAVSPVIRAKSPQIAYAISTIFLFNIAAVLAFPPLGHALGLSQQDFGLFAGTAVNDTSSVVAAASTYGRSAADHAVVVKLTRTLMIIPVCLALAAVSARRGAAATRPAGGGRDAAAARRPRRRVGPLRLVPWFLVGFLTVAAASSAGLVPAASHAGLSRASLFLITTALAAIGLSTDPGQLRRTGVRPVILGAALWLVVTASSLLLQLATR